MHYNHAKLGAVYIMRGPTGLLKIGSSHNPSKRQLQVRDPYGGQPIELVYESTPVPLCHRIETAAHDRLNEYRVAGEWFDVDLSRAVGVVETEVDRLSEYVYKNMKQFGATIRADQDELLIDLVDWRRGQTKSSVLRKIIDEWRLANADEILRITSEKNRSHPIK